MVLVSVISEINGLSFSRTSKRLKISMKTVYFHFVHIQASLGLVLKNGVYVINLVRGGSIMGHGASCFEFCSVTSKEGNYFQSGNPYYLKCFDAQSSLNYIQLAYNNSVISVTQQPFNDIADCMRMTSSKYILSQTNIYWFEIFISALPEKIY